MDAVTIKLLLFAGIYGLLVVLIVFLSTLAANRRNRRYMLITCCALLITGGLPIVLSRIPQNSAFGNSTFGLVMGSEFIGLVMIFCALFGLVAGAKLARSRKPDDGWPGDYDPSVTPVRPTPPAVDAELRR